MMHYDVLLLRSPRLCVLIYVAIALGVTCASAHEEEPSAQLPKKVSVEALYKPTPLPDRVILTFKTNPARSQAVTWRTDTSIKKGLAQITVAEASAKFVRRTKELVATTEPLKPANYHSVNFDALQPATKYVYRVGDGVNWTEWFQFQTASEQPAPFSFIYFGDAQNDLRAHWSRVIREAHSDAPKARFMLHAGDLVNRGNDDAEWGEWFGAGSWLNAMVPSVPVVGNHEYPRDKSKDPPPPSELTHHWRPQFTLPENGPKELSETTYWLDYQGVRIVALNSNERQAEQVAWLEHLLKDNPNTWTIVSFHHPIFSTARGRDNPELRAAWKPILDKYRVDLVLNGHDHSYARFGQSSDENVPSGTKARSPEGGTVYVVSVSGPKMYNLERRPEMRRAAEDTQLYQIISINGTTLRYEARTATGEVYDAFRLLKRPGQLNEVVDEIPNTPERKRDPEPKN